MNPEVEEGRCPTCGSEDAPCWIHNRASEGWFGSHTPCYDSWHDAIDHITYTEEAHMAANAEFEMKQHQVPQMKLQVFGGVNDKPKTRPYLRLCDAQGFIASLDGHALRRLYEALGEALGYEDPMTTPNPEVERPDERVRRIENALWHAEQVRPPTVATATARNDLSSLVADAAALREERNRLRTTLAKVLTDMESVHEHKYGVGWLWNGIVSARAALSTYDKAPG